MDWYWLLLAVFILGIGLFLWVILRSRLYDRRSLEFQFRRKSDQVGTTPKEIEPPLAKIPEPEPHPRETMVGGYFPGEADHELVNFAAFVPRDIRPGSYFLLDIWAYLLSDYNFVCSIARELSQDINAGRKIGIPITRGTFLTILIDIPALKVYDPIDTLTWEGHPANTTYIVEVSASMGNGSYPGKAVISSDGIPIAKLSFLISVSSIENAEFIDCTVERKYIKTAFASYASQNREEVLARIHGMKKVAPELDVILDVFSLRSGQNWQAKLEEHVPTKDIFYLFWSQYAACSEWVEKEWRLAISRRGLGYIDPVPLEEPDRAPPPQELNALHFSDAYLAYIRHERNRKELKCEVHTEN